VIAATNRDLGNMVENGQFRADLWYRLNVIAITLPPLRERREDIQLLAKHFLDRLSVREGKPGLRLAPEVMERLIRYDWPGNVRELSNEIERLIVFTPSHCEITEEKLSQAIRRCDGENERQNVVGIVPPPAETRLADAMSAYEQLIIRSAIRRHNGNHTRAAKELGISPQWLRQLLKKR
jgi:transcriptional regulator with PAS, ATPase and Fis domain